MEKPRDNPVTIGVVSVHCDETASWSVEKVTDQVYTLIQGGSLEGGDRLIPVEVLPNAVEFWGWFYLVIQAYHNGGRVTHGALVGV